jgi:hypothetical protein
MFCSACALEVSTELIFCNRCGNNLRPLTIAPGDPPVRFRGALPVLATVITLVTLFGFGLAFGLAMAFLDRHVELRQGPLALIVVILCATVAIDFMLVQLLLRVLHLGPITASRAGPMKVAGASSKQMREPAPRWLEEPRVPVDSVTDHTTRTLPPVYVDRQVPR